MTGLYVHVPFCRQKCLYCDFNSYAGCDRLYRPYLDALRHELDLVFGGNVPEFSTLYVGGGTPTVLPAPALAALVRDLGGAAHLGPDSEVSMEANPGTVDGPSLRLLRKAGVNRMSLGVQSLDDGLLRMLGRIHSAEEARQAARLARASGFANLSLDLMYGLPGQTLRQWQDSLRGVLRWGPDHLSLYALTVEPETPLAQQIERGALPVPEDDLAADMYEWAQEALAEAGFGHYEVSNWALPGYECRHNLVYWRNEPYLGLGAGAHSWWGGTRWANLPRPADYSGGVGEGRRPVDEHEEIGRAVEMGETMMMGLRLLDEGVSQQRFRERFGVSIGDVYAQELDGLAQRGLIEVSGARVRLTPQGRLLGNQAFVEFV